MKKSWGYTLFISLMTCIPAYAEMVQNVPGDKNPPMFEYTIYEIGETPLNKDIEFKKYGGEKYEIDNNFTLDELHSLGSAGVIWDSILNNPLQKTGAKVIIYHLNEDDANKNNAFANSPEVEYYVNNNTLGDYKITALNAVINGKKYIKDGDAQDSETGKYYDAYIGVGFGLSDEFPGWDTSTDITALFQGTLPNIVIVMEHELAHALGVASGAVSYKVSNRYVYSAFSEIVYDSDDNIDEENSGKLSVYDKYIRVYDSSLGHVVSAKKGMPIFNDSSKISTYGFKPSEVFNISKDAPYFAGPNTMKVLSGTGDDEVSGLVEDEIIKYCEDKISDAGGIVNYANYYTENNMEERVNGLPLNVEGAHFPELSHIELRNSYMSHQGYRNWITFMEAELAVLKDIGYDINLKEYFGKSFYLDNTAANITDNYSLNKNQAVGVHLYSDNNNITQSSDIITDGKGSFGVRIDGVNNTYTIENGTIDSKGANSIGLGVTYGSGHNINIKQGSVVKASGANSSAVSFDFGKNMLGAFYENKGSYIHTDSGNNQPLEELDGALVENFNVDGAIEASGDAQNAIYISPNAYVKNINIQENAKIDGAIVSRWNSEKSDDFGPVQSRNKLYTNVNFGADNEGNLDNSYVGFYSGKIDGNSVVDNVDKNTLKMNLAGTLNLGNSDINVYNINNTGTINVHSKTNLATLNTSQSIQGDGDINVDSGAVLTLGANTQNVANNINLANNAELSTINQSQNLVTIKQLNSEADSKLSLDLGDTFNIQNSDGTGVKLSQIKADEDTLKGLEDGQTYQVFKDDSEQIDLNGSAGIYYSGNKYSVSQDEADSKLLKVTWAGYSSGLREAAQDETAANYVNTEMPQPYEGGTVAGNKFEVSGLDVDFDNKYDGLTVDGNSNSGGTIIKTGFYGGLNYNLKVQNGGILTVDASNKDIKVGNTDENAFIINNGTVNLYSNNNGIAVKGNIQGTNRGTDNLNISGNNKIEINKVSNVIASNISDYAVLNDESKNVEWKLNSGVLSVSNDANLSSDKTNSLSFNGGALNVANNSANPINLERMELNSNADVIIDVDLAEKKADTFVFDDASNVVLNGNKLNISNVNYTNAKTVLTDANYNIPIINSEYKNEALLGNVSSTAGNKVMTPIYKYGVGYAENTSAGNIVLSRSNTGSYKDYNPAIFASTVGAQVGGYLTQINSYDMAFANMDMLMSLPTAKRNALKYKNQYAIQDTSKLMTYSPNQLPEEYKGLWFKPYATFEKVHLKDGPKVENSIYSSYFGGDSDIIKHKRGWNSMYSGYFGYNGSHQSFDGVSIYQNGGQIGATGMLYKDRFFAGVTAGAGLGIGDASTMYGDEDFSLLNAGAAVKTGYNFGYKDDKLILQPSVLAGYSFINTYDYTNAAGVRIKTDDLHGLELVPGLKLIGNLPNNWQPYATVQFVWNMLTDTKTSANGIGVNQFKIKPYIQYGVGVQKRVGDSFTGYFQSMGRNFGRNGVSLSAGMRWAVGRNKKENL